MSEEEKKSGSNIPIKPNAPYWKPQKYYNLAAYVLMFNEIVANYSDFGLSNANGDQVINNYIFENIEAFNERVTDTEKFEFIKIPEGMPKRPVKPADRPEVKDASYDDIMRKYEDKKAKYDADMKEWLAGKVFDGKTWKADDEHPEKDAERAAKREKELAKYNAAIQEFKTDKGNITGYVKELNKAINGDTSKYLSNTQMYDVLEAKTESVKKWYDSVRKATAAKSGKDDKDGEVRHFHDYDNAISELRDRKMKMRSNGWRSFRRFVTTALFGAVTVASVGALLSYGGFALTAMFGTAFNATGVGGAVLGFVGTFAGGTFTKKFFGRWLDSLNEGRKLRKDKREFMHGYGKYADETGIGKTRKAKGFYARRQRYYESLAIKKFLEGYKEFDPNSVKGSRFKKWLARRRHEKYLGFKPEDAYLAKYIRRGIRRGSIINTFDENGMPLDLKQLKKEAGFFQYVNISTADPRKNFDFHRMRAMLSAQKAGNIEDVLSTQGEVVTAEAFLKDNTRTLEEYANSAMAFETRAKEKFKNDNQNKFIDLMHRYTESILGAVDRELFNSSYSSTLRESAEADFTQPSIKAMFENQKYRSTSESALNAFKFVEVLEKDKFAGGVLSDTVDASIENQIYIDKKHMEDACSRFRIAREYADPANPSAMKTSPVYQAREIACQSISNIARRGDANYQAALRAIEYIKRDETEIPVDGERIKTAEYLRRMLDKKVAETCHSAESIESEIRATTYSVPDPIITSIASIDAKTSPAKIAEIKQKIMADRTLSADADAQKFAFKKVQEQIDAIERKRKNDSIVKVFPIIRGNECMGFESLMKMIPKSEDTIDPGKLAITLSNFKKVTPAEMSEFLILKLQDKVESILKREILSDKFDVKENENLSVTIDKLRLFMSKINHCEKNGIINTYQTSAILKSAEEKIINAFTPFMRDFERDFLKDGAQTTSEKAVRYLDNVLGFGHFFNSGSAVATDLKNKLTRIRDAKILEELLKASGKGAFEGIKDFDKEETKTTLRIYFMKDRDSSDPLYKCLNEMKNATDSTEIDPLKPEQITAMKDVEDRILGGGTITGLDKNKSFVYKMNKILENMDADLGVDNHEDKIAALLTMKKRVLAMLKVQMNTLYESKKGVYGNNISSFISTEGSPMSRAILKKWETIAREIDAKITEEAKFVTSDYGASAVGNLYDAIEGGTSVRKYSEYMYSPNM